MIDKILKQPEPNLPTISKECCKNCDGIKNGLSITCESCPCHEPNLPETQDREALTQESMNEVNLPEPSGDMTSDNKTCCDEPNHFHCEHCLECGVKDYRASLKERIDGMKKGRVAGEDKTWEAHYMGYDEALDDVLKEIN